MTTVRENLETIANDFKDAMLEKAGKDVTVQDVFDAVRKFVSGDYDTLTEMYDQNKFNQQNTVFQAVRMLLDQMGTPLKDQTKRKGKQLGGNAFAMQLLQQKGLQLPQPSKKEKTVESTTVS